MASLVAIKLRTSLSDDALTRERSFMMFCLMKYICIVLNNFIIVPEMLMSLYAKQNTVAKPQKTTFHPNSFSFDKQASVMAYSFD